MNKKKICVIMVNYNNSQLSIDCYQSIINQRDAADFTIIVVDNNSKDDEKRILKEFQNCHPDFEVIYSSKNLGYFPGMVEGQKYAYSKGNDFDYMLAANNDLIYEKDFFKTLTCINVDERVMVISPDIIRTDGHHQNPHFIQKPSAMRNFLYHIYFSNWYVSCALAKIQDLFHAKRLQKNKPGYETEQYIYMGFGACFILSRTFMNEIKFLDASSFLMGEEQLLTIQVAEAHGKIRYIPRLKVYHLDSATFKTMPSRFAYENMRKAFKLYQRKLKKFQLLDNQRQTSETQETLDFFRQYCWISVEFLLDSCRNRLCNSLIIKVRCRNCWNCWKFFQFPCIFTK